MSEIDTSEHKKLVTAPEVLKIIDIDEAVDEAIKFCQNLKLNHSLWEGVEPLPERQAQAKKSVELLRGFNIALKKADIRRWEAFREFMHSHNQIEDSNFEKVWISNNILYQKENHIGLNAASAELISFFNYLEAIHANSQKSWNDEVRTDFNNHRISVIISEFLTMHVGHGSHRVKALGRTGFDGDDKTCPISVAPGRAILNFGVACAEYVLMNAIAEKFNSDDKGQSDDTH